MNREKSERETPAISPGSGLAGWPRLALVERIALAPRQSLALVEAEGRRFLVATSPEGGPAFYALDAQNQRGTPARSSGSMRPVSSSAGRVSW
jgi:hypothetical protein